MVYSVQMCVILESLEAEYICILRFLKRIFFSVI